MDGKSQNFIQNILIVDDNPNNLYSFSQLLARDDLSIATAQNAEEALKKLIEKEYALILLDVQMPDINGLELARLIKSREKTKKIPILFITAYYKANDFIKEGFEIGAVDYITKPIDNFLLKSKVDVFLKLSYREKKLIEKNHEIYNFNQNLEKIVKERSEEIIKKEIRYQALVEAFPDVIYQIDTEGEILFISSSIKDYGYNPDDLLGNSISSVFGEKDFKKIFRKYALPPLKGQMTGDRKAPKLIDERRTGNRMTKNLELKVKTLSKQNQISGNVPKHPYRHVSINACGWWDKDAQDKNKNFLGSIGIIRDITEQKTSEKKLNEYTKHLEKDLESKKEGVRKAQLLQRNLNTNKNPVIPDINILSYYMPCEELSGDYFEIIKGNKENKLVVILGDATGHGIEASMDATLIKSITDNYISLLFKNSDTGSFLNSVNRSLIKYIPEEHFPTMFVGVIDLNTKTITYSNANAKIPYVINHHNVIPLPEANGFFLTYNPSDVFETKSYQLKPHDILFFYSDALTEIKSRFQNQPDGIVGSQKIRKLISEFGNGIGRDSQNLLDKIKKINGSFPLEDDLTMLFLEYIPSSQKVFYISKKEDQKTIENPLLEDLCYYGYHENDRSQIMICLSELVLNGIVHGNQNDSQKKVKVNYEINCESVKITVTDEGEGFDPESVDDPTDFSNLQTAIKNHDTEKFTHGRGIWLTKLYMDNLKYNEKGNEAVINFYKTPLETFFYYIDTENIKPTPPHEKDYHDFIKWHENIDIDHIIKIKSDSIKIVLPKNSFLTSVDIGKILKIIKTCSEKQQLLNIKINNEMIRKMFHKLSIDKFDFVKLT